MNNTIFILIFLQTLGLYSKIQVCGDCQVNSLKSAIAKAEIGETILVSGTYTDSKIYVNKPVNIIGVNNPVIISKNGEEVFNISAENVMIKNITIRDMKTSCWR